MTPSPDYDVLEGLAKAAVDALDAWNASDDQDAIPLAIISDRAFALCMTEVTPATILALIAAARPSLEPPASDVAGWREPLGRTLYEAFWARNGGNAPAWSDQASAIRNMWDNIAADAKAAAPPHPASKEVRDV